jgi:hypothetical protein
MKTRILIVFAVVALVVAFAYTASTPAAPNKANANAVPTAVPQPSTATATAAEPHPEIHEAIAALRRAKEHMEHAARDFSGHACKSSGRPMWPFTSLRIALSTTETKA